jgi:hypothetical protein
MYSILHGLRFITVVIMNTSVFWDIMQNSPLKSNQHFGRKFFLILTSCWAYSSILKMEAKFSSETSSDFQRNTRSYTPEYRSLHVQFCRMRFEVFTAVKV